VAALVAFLGYCQVNSIQALSGKLLGSKLLVYIKQDIQESSKLMLISDNLTEPEFVIVTARIGKSRNKS
jgi:hypothetical protein